MNRTKQFYITLLLLLVGLVIFACDTKEEDKLPFPPLETHEAATIINQIWQGSPFNVNSQRLEAFNKIQEWADICSASYFKSYLKSLDAASEIKETNDPILYCYRQSFDRVLNGIQNNKPEDGTVVLWSLYNMGYIVQTSSVCFGIDIYHRWAKQLAPHLDFLCVTHNHTDHYDRDLIQAMFDNNKPVLSNYQKKNSNYPYTSKFDKTYTINDLVIKTSITDHNNSTAGKNFVTVFRFEFGEENENFSLLHCGDSNYKKQQYHNVAGDLNVLILRYAPEPHGLSENNIIGDEAGQVQPSYVLLSHILELGHDGVQNSRWSLDMALKRASQINNENTIVPFWGEKLIWKAGILQ